MMLRNLRYLVLLLALPVVVPASAFADEAADAARKAEIARKKEEARKRAEEKKAAADKAAADAKTAADKAAADAKAAADKAAADAKAAAGGATGTGGATSSAAGGGAGGKASGGAPSKGTGGATSTTKVEEKDPPLPVGDIETLRKDRPDRRKTTVERLRRRWGSILANATGAADLKQHSRRVAFLQRIRVVAEAKKDKKTVEAVDELLTAEDDRHSKAMNALREGAL
jgi:hypothetical protein